MESVNTENISINNGCITLQPGVTDEEVKAAITNPNVLMAVNGINYYHPGAPTRLEKMVAAILLGSTPQPEPQYLFLWPNKEGQEYVGVMPKGDMATFSGQPKAGKSSAIVVLLAAVLLGDYCGIKSLIKPNELVIYVDTEQNPNNTYNTILMSLVKIYAKHKSVTKDQARQDILRRIICSNMRQFSKEERRHNIINTVKILNPALIFIDGIRDLAVNINDQAESGYLTDEFMNILKSEGTCVANVLHENFAARPDDPTKLRGSLGSECYNKGDVLQVKWDRTSHTRQMQWTFLRGSGIPDPVCFTRNTDDGLPQAITIASIRSEQEIKLKGLVDKLIMAMMPGKSYTKAELELIAQRPNVTNLSRREATNVIKQLQVDPRIRYNKALKNGQSSSYIKIAPTTDLNGNEPEYNNE